MCPVEDISDASFKFCAGIELVHYLEHYFEVIHFYLKSLCQTEVPFYQMDSVNCKLWFEVPIDAPLTFKSCAEVTCSACKRLISDLDWQLKCTKSENPMRKVQRQAASLRSRLIYMSPNSWMKQNRTV